MTSFNEIIIKDLTDCEKFTRKHLVTVYNKYRNIWNAFKTNSFSIKYGDDNRITVLTNEERILIDNEIDNEISNEMRNNKIIYKQEATAIVLQRNRQLLKPLYRTIYNLFNALSAELIQTHYACECGSSVVMSHKSHHLKTQLHIDFINKVPPKPKAESILLCGCGKSFSLKNKSQHLKTQLHIDFINKVPPKPKAETTLHCGCGKSFSLKNKSHHDKTKYHLDCVKMSYAPS
jgi:hypothetical protein